MGWTRDMSLLGWAQRVSWALTHILMCVENKPTVHFSFLKIHFPIIFQFFIYKFVIIVVFAFIYGSI